MKKKINANEMDLKTLMTFNMLKEVCQDQDIVAKALHKCNSINFDDKTGLITLNPTTKASIDANQRNEDCIVYIENMNKKMNETNLLMRFSEFGKVLYCKIPKLNNESRGYAFVEFKENESANSAVE
ncbi:MAG: La- protein 7, partial [Paramarteilia canceri]